MARIEIPPTGAQWNQRGKDYLPGRLGIEFLAVEPDEVRAYLPEDAEVRAESTGKTIAHFRRTQMILRKKAATQ